MINSLAKPRHVNATHSFCDDSSGIGVSESGHGTDGGWSQEPGMQSDAYATGQALVMLAERSNQESNYSLKETQTTSMNQDDRVERGIRFLVKNQKQPGLWHFITRAVPDQPFFDNGDPCGKDQFISIMATAWSTTALNCYLDPGIAPLSFSKTSKTKN